MKMRAGTFNSPTATGSHSFDTGLGEAPQAVLLVTAGIAEGAVTPGQMSSFGAADGTSQWVSSLVIPYGTDDRPNKKSQEFPAGGGVNTARCIYTHNAGRAAELDASLTSLNSDGTVTLNWATVRTTGRAVGFAAFADLPHAKCGTIALDPGGVSNSPIDFNGLGFMAKCVFFSCCWFDEVGNTFNEATNGLGHIVIEVDAPANPSAIVNESFGGEYVRNNNTNFDVLYEVEANAIQMRRVWTPSGVDTQGFTLTRTGGTFAQGPVGYLAIGGDDWHVLGGGNGGGTPDHPIDTTMKVFGGFRVGAPDSGGVAGNAEGITGNERTSAWFGFYDELSNQFVMSLYGENDDDLHGSMDGMFSALYDDRATAQIDGVFGTADLEVWETVDVPSRGEPVWTMPVDGGGVDGYLDIQPFFTYSWAFVTWAPAAPEWRPQIIRHYGEVR